MRLSVSSATRAHHAPPIRGPSPPQHGTSPRLAPHRDLASPSRLTPPHPTPPHLTSSHPTSPLNATSDQTTHAFRWSHWLELDHFGGPERPPPTGAQPARERGHAAAAPQRVLGGCHAWLATAGHAAGGEGAPRAKAAHAHLRAVLGVLGDRHGRPEKGPSLQRAPEGIQHYMASLKYNLINFNFNVLMACIYVTSLRLARR